MLPSVPVRLHQLVRQSSSSLACLALLASCGSDEASQDGIGGAPGAAAPLIAGEIDVTAHPTQPMVLDVTVPLHRSATVRAIVTDDPGARSREIERDDASVTVRLRGLLPDTVHEIEVTARDENGHEESRTGLARTLEALDAFFPRFEVASLGDHSDTLRLFDLSVFPTIARSTIVAVDAAGRTRFHLPTPTTDESPNPVPRIPAAVQLLDDGTLLFVQEYAIVQVDELGQRVSEVRAEDLGLGGFHHELEVLPNGNYLTMTYEIRDVPGSPGRLTGDGVVELTPNGEVVWQWDTFEALDTARLFPSADVYVPDPYGGAPGADWTHGNAAVYSPTDDSILVSLRHQDWLLKVDRPSRQLVWKLGPEGDFTLEGGSQWFRHQHAPEWQPDGTLLLYDNHTNDPTLPEEEWRTRIVRYDLDETARVARQEWEEANEPFVANVAGDVDRLENGNYLVVDSTVPIPGPVPTRARLREVDSTTGEWTWVLDLPNGWFVYRAVPTTRLPGEVSTR